MSGEPFQLAAAGEIPHRNGRQRDCFRRRHIRGENSADNQPRTVRAKRDRTNRRLVSTRGLSRDRLSGGLGLDRPHANRLVRPACGNQLAIGRDGEIGQRLGGTGEHRDLFAIGQRPLTHGLVRSAGQHVRPAQREGDSGDRACVSRHQPHERRGDDVQRVLRIAGKHGRVIGGECGGTQVRQSKSFERSADVVPNAHAIGGHTEQTLAVGAHRHVPHRVGVSGQHAERRAVGRVPQLDRLVGTAGNEQLAVAAGRDAGHGGRVIERANRRSVRQVPLTHRHVGGPGNQRGGTDRQGGDGSGVTGEGANFQAVGDLPLLERTIGRAGKRLLRIGTNSDRGHCHRVSNKLGDLWKLRIGEVPHSGRLVGRAGNQLRLVRAEGEPGDGGFVSVERRFHRAGRRVANHDRGLAARQATGGHQRSVGTERHDLDGQRHTRQRLRGGRQFPNPQRAVVAHGSKLLTLRVKGESPHRTGVGRERRLSSPVRDVPETNGAVFAAAGDQRAAGRQRRHGTGVTGERTDNLTADHIADPQHAVRTADDDLLSVRACRKLRDGCRCGGQRLRRGGRRIPPAHRAVVPGGEQRLAVRQVGRERRRSGVTGKQPLRRALGGVPQADRAEVIAGRQLCVVAAKRDAANTARRTGERANGGPARRVEHLDRFVRRTGRDQFAVPADRD